MSTSVTLTADVCTAPYYIIPGTGEVCLLTLNSDKNDFVELKDSAINATATPTLFADIREIYLASVGDNDVYDETTKPDGSNVIKDLVENTNLVISEAGATDPQRFDQGSSSDGFDSDTMKLIRAYEMVFEVDSGGVQIVGHNS